MQDHNPEIPREVSAALEGFLEVLGFASDPCFTWQTADLQAAFEWANALQNIGSNPDLATSLRTAAQEASKNIPASLQTCLQEALQSPARLLLHRLLQCPGLTAEWPLTVLGAYMSSCGLATLEQDSQRAQGELRDVLVNIQQVNSSAEALHRLHKTVGASKFITFSTNSIDGTSLSSTTESSSEYFTSRRGLDVAGIAFLLRNRLESGSLSNATSLRDALGRETLGMGKSTMPAPSSEKSEHIACAEVLLMGMCLHDEQLKIKTPQSNDAHIDNTTGDGDVQMAQTAPKLKVSSPSPNVFEEAACELLQTWPELVVQVPPALLSHACRASFKLTMQIVEAIQTIQQISTATTQLMPTVQTLCGRDDHTSEYIKHSLKTTIPLS